MTGTIPHPRLLIAAGALILAAGIAYAVAAEGGEKDPPLQAVPVPGTELPRVDAAERAQALATLTSSPLFLEATGGRQWTAVSEMPNTTDGKKVGVGLIVELESPVDSDGPWLAVYCKGTVSQEFRFPYQGVSRLGTVFDGDGRLIGLLPLPSESLAFDEDAATTPPPECPEGFEDEEN